MKHIKKFNEEIYLRGGVDTKGNTHHYTHTTDGTPAGTTISELTPRSELKEFVENFISELTEINSKKYSTSGDLLFLEELYDMYKNRY